ncbi:MAG: flagellar hook-length control protein FliK [Lachnospiraceae bacterium]|nr:flagellar hook-length control protein FliK [Lachnospiraceae bacterium]
MTTGSVSKINPINELTGMARSRTKGNVADNFSDVLKSSSDQTQGTDSSSNKQPQKKVENKQDAKKIENNDNKDVKTTAKESKTDASKAETDVNEEVNKVDEAAFEAAAQMVQTVAQVLDTDGAQVDEALEILDLETIDLLDSTNIPMVVVEVTQSEDSTAIMTDENLFADVKEIQNQADAMMEGLEKELGIPKEDIKAALAELKEEKPQVVTDSDENLQAVQNNTEEPQLKVDKKDASQTGQNGAENQMNWTQSVVDGIKAAAAEATAEPETVYSTDMERIYEQVNESLKLNMTEDMTEMEMNLHPASLGNVRIQVAARDGIVTANFTTQNEQVKAVLEAQIVELKETMNEQGIKVEAIEVNVAAHAFEENLSKEGDNSSDYESRGSKKRRSINLNEIDDIDDIDNDGDDEIRIAREMMMHNGTTVDYMA